MRKFQMSNNSKNRAFWNSTSPAYQAAHGATLSETAMAWGVWRIPESDLAVLGKVEGRRILELGCGAAQWTLALLQSGARAVGVDFSEEQLGHARSLSCSIGSAIPLIQGDAEKLPFRSGAFDVVFCDHGATVFAPPEVTISEAARVLRSDGILAFCMSTPIRDMCFDSAADAVTPQLVRNYFALSTFDDGHSVEHQLPYGDWVRLFRRHGLIIEDLIELQAPAEAETSFADFVPAAWAREWPAEHIWKMRKET